MVYHTDIHSGEGTLKHCWHCCKTGVEDMSGDHTGVECRRINTGGGQHVGGAGQQVSKRCGDWCKSHSHTETLGDSPKSHGRSITGSLSWRACADWGRRILLWRLCCRGRGEEVLVVCFGKGFYEGVNLAGENGG